MRRHSSLEVFHAFGKIMTKSDSKTIYKEQTSNYAMNALKQTIKQRSDELKNQHSEIYGNSQLTGVFRGSSNCGHQYSLRRHFQKHRLDFRTRKNTSLSIGVITVEIQKF